MGIFGQNTGKTITKREQCTSKGAIYRGNPHFQPFFNHRTRPPQIHQLRTVFTPTHTITHRNTVSTQLSPHNQHRYTPPHTHRSPHTAPMHARHLCTVTRLTCLDLRNYSVTYVDYPHPLRAPTPFKGWGLACAPESEQKSYLR